MDTTELDKAPGKDSSLLKEGSHIIVELVEYEHNAAVSKTIMKKLTGSVNAMSFDSGEGLNERISPFDTYVQVIDGSAVISIDGKVTKLQTGEGIIIPAHKSSFTEPNGRFKMLLTVIKSGYED